MAKLGINTGSSPDAGDGDSLLIGALKINSNFDEIYNSIGDGTNLHNSIGYASTAGIATYASVSRVVVKDDGSTVGTAGTIDFGTGLLVSAVSAGVVTVTASVGTSSQWVTTAAGIHTLSNVGIGTTNPTSAFTVVGSGASLSQLYVSGFSTSVYLNVPGGAYLNPTNSQLYYQGNLKFQTLDTGNEIVGSQKITGAGLGLNIGGIPRNGIQFVSSVYDQADFYHSESGLLSINNYFFDGGQIKISLNAPAAGSASEIVRIKHDAVGVGTTNPTSKLTVQSTGSASDGENAAHPFAIKQGTFDRTLWMGYATNIGGIGEEGAYINAASTGFSRPIYLSSRNQSQTPFVGIGTDRPTGTSGQMLQVNGGAYVSGNLGIGTINPTSALTVQGDVRVSGVVTATTFVGNFSGSITDATNLTGGTANASSLNVSGIATISQGRIQADAGANLRFGNVAAGSGSGRNIAIGDQVLVSLSGGLGRNIGIGELSYHDTSTGQYNIGIGERAGQKVTTGAYNVILGAYDGNSDNLDIRTSSRNVVIADGEGTIRQYINSSGNVGIKTTVITEALTVAGIVSATGFYGTLNAGQLTGSLPAIDGSALIGVVGSGSGVVIEDDATPIGTAGTINFGSNLSVSFASGIATVTGSGLATYANVSGIATYATTAGFATASNTATYSVSSGISTTSGTAGYASTAGISSAVSGTININTTGIITASSFSGSASGLTNIPSGQLTGALPAIDGSALLNVTAAGTGVGIHDDQVNVGSATTIDFGTGLDVTFSAGIATITSSGGSLQSRTTVTGVTTSIANNGIGNTDITGFKSYALLKVGLSTAGWLRLYTDSTSRANDVSRSVGEDPAPGSGVIAEVVTTGISTTQIISPFVMGGNLDNPVDTTIYAAITNLSGSTQAITANLTILQLEA